MTQRIAAAFEASVWHTTCWGAGMRNITYAPFLSITLLLAACGGNDNKPAQDASDHAAESADKANAAADKAADKADRASDKANDAADSADKADSK